MLPVIRTPPLGPILSARLRPWLSRVPRWRDTSPSRPTRSPDNVYHIVPAPFGSDGVVGGTERYALELARQMGDRVSTTLVTSGRRQRENGVGPLRVTRARHPWLVRGQRTNPFSLRVFRALCAAPTLALPSASRAREQRCRGMCRVTGKRVFVTDLGGGGWDVSAYMSTDACSMVICT